MRCKGCNATLKEREVIWNEDRQAFEELCLACRNWVSGDLLAGLDSLAEPSHPSSTHWFSLGDGCWWVRGLDKEH